MLDLALSGLPGKQLRVLCIGAHSDDVEIGCAGTLLALQARRRDLSIDHATLSGDPVRHAEAELAFRRLVRPGQRGDVHHAEFSDGCFPAEYAAIKQWFEALKRRSRPDVVFCHARDDRHQDHRVVNEMTWNTFRDSMILEFEVPKWDGDLGQPNVYVPLTRRQAERKADVLTTVFASQAARHWFTRDTFLSLARLRGVECRSPSGYAEAFHGRKLRFGV